MFHIGKKPDFFRKACIPLLAFCWFSGIALGALTGCSAGDSAISLMRAVSDFDVSIVALFFSQVLPFLISAIAVYIHAPWLLLLISFGKAFTFSFCASILTLAYGSAGWLLRLLLMFSDFCLCPVLLLFWARHIFADQKLNLSDCCACLMVIAAIVYWDHSFVSPFLHTVLNY